MQLIKRIFDFYIYSNIHVALAGFCITKISLIKFGIAESLTPYFVALSIIISYNFIRYYEIRTKHLNWFRSWFFDNKKKLLLLTFLSFSGIGYITFFSEFEIESVVILIPFVFMTFFYVVPLFKIRNMEVSFRNFPSIKIFSIAIAWAGISVFFPLYEAKHDIDLDVYLEFIQRFLLLIVVALPFDIRDVKVDSNQLNTIPQALGVGATKKVGFVLLAEFILLELFKQNYSNNELFIVIAIAIITGLFLGFSSPYKTRYYTSFWVESIPMIWIGLYMLF